MKKLISGKLHRAVRRLRKRFVSKTIILLYHRVAEVDLDPWSLSVTPQHFAEHLEVLGKFGHPLSLQQLASAHRDGNIPHRGIVVTFDDGYADNLHHAKPLLKRYDIPATVFVSTGHIGQEFEFWWDTLARLLLQPGQLPEKLCLTLNGSTYEWELGAAANYSEEEYQQNRTRQPWGNPAGSRLYLYHSLWKLLRPLPEREQLKVLEEIRIWGNIKATNDPMSRSLLPDELHRLAEGDLVEIGAHTVTHPFLPDHSEAFQRDEIKRSKAYLEEVLDRQIASFAYPFGGYGSETVNLMEDAGFACACSTVKETVWRNSHCFLLPRFGVGNWNGEEFEKQLRRWSRD